jgi:hypothetical protein
MQCPFYIRHEVLPDVNSQLRGFDDDIDVFSQVISPVRGFSVFHSTDQIVHIRKYFVPNGEWTLHPPKRGVTLSLYEWKELKKTIPLFEDRGPELRTMDNTDTESAS